MADAEPEPKRKRRFRRAPAISKAQKRKQQRKRKLEREAQEKLLQDLTSEPLLQVPAWDSEAIASAAAVVASAAKRKFGSTSGVTAANRQDPQESRVSKETSKKRTRGKGQEKGEGAHLDGHKLDANEEQYKGGQKRQKTRQVLLGNRKSSTAAREGDVEMAQQDEYANEKKKKSKNKFKTEEFLTRKPILDARKKRNKEQGSKQQRDPEQRNAAEAPQQGRQGTDLCQGPKSSKAERPSKRATPGSFPQRECTKAARKKRSGEDKSLQVSEPQNGSLQELDPTLRKFAASFAEDCNHTATEHDSDVAPEKPLTKKERRRKQREGKQAEWMAKQNERPQAEARGEQTSLAHGPRRNSLLDKMRLRLAGGQFRMVNETLYTSSGEEGLELFTKQPQLFFQYHEGYREQVKKWPQSPLDVCVQWINARSKSLTVADFGCGEAELALRVRNSTVFSMDLVPVRPEVIQCNIADTPLEASSVDIAVFCLSLMGNDYDTFLTEAARVLKPRGWLLIAEVKSRFEGQALDHLVSAVREMGFDLQSQDLSNKMFVFLVFRGHDTTVRVMGEELSWPHLKPCVYKKR
mmetsp:Transcript_6911/g.25464  ORF Transcript_6911/g.25464 Transcript_6911/m.25464 type:complete len:579 (+) Transcript_6911:106-1842(+)|eukprot:scaffold175_cov414-Prasinococcus_capsulatus_cf.AAC.37